MRHPQNRHGAGRARRRSPGYDETGADGIAKALTATDAETARKVRTYEREHKDRVGVIEAADSRIERN